MARPRRDAARLRGRGRPRPRAPRSASGSRCVGPAPARSSPSARWPLPFVVALLVEAAAYGLGGDRIQERYFFYAVPLVGILFGLYASRGWPHRLAHGVFAAGIVLLAARVPLAGYSAADGKTNAPTLFATARLEQAFGDVATASLLLALLVTVLVAAVALASRRPSVATPLALGLALLVSTATYAAAVSFNLANAERTRTDVLGPEPSFVDSSGVEGAAMLLTRSSERGVVSAYLFWNRSLEAVYLLPGAEPPDSFAVTRLTIAEDGTLLAGGRPVTRPLAADAFSDTVIFHDSDEIAAAPAFRLVASPGPQRLALYAPGRYADGWLGLRGSFQLWPESRRGCAHLRADGPRGLAPGRRRADAARPARARGDRGARANEHGDGAGLRRRPVEHGLRRAVHRRGGRALRQRAGFRARVPGRPRRLRLAPRRSP